MSKQHFETSSRIIDSDEVVAAVEAVLGPGVTVIGRPLGPKESRRGKVGAGLRRASSHDKNVFPQIRERRRPRGRNDELRLRLGDAERDPAAQEPVVLPVRRGTEGLKIC
jgi:hypothetical protein